MNHHSRFYLGLLKFCPQYFWAIPLSIALISWNGMPVSAQDEPKAAETANTEPETEQKSPAKQKPEAEVTKETKKDEGEKTNAAKQDGKPKPAEKSGDPSAEKKKMQSDGKESEAKKSDGKDKDTDKPKSDEKPAKPQKPAPPSEDPDLVAQWQAKGVWLSPPTDGPAAVDFGLVGEFVGELKDSSQGAKRLGVQIRALGNGQFEARAYPGGLPGQDEYTEEGMMVLIGRRSGQTLVLSGGPWAMFAGQKQCKIIDAEGATLAELPRAERTSPTLGAKAPEGAMVLFDGTGTDAFINGEMTPHGLLRQGADINFLLSDFDLHLEFRIPHMPKYLEQARGNSGLYLQSRYECQVLDSFGADRVFNGLGALYRHKAADVNMALPPLAWQTYDVHFTAARYAADGKKLRDAHVTAWVNGVKVQDNQSLPGPTGHGQTESVTLLPTKFQDHNDPVRYRNVWVIDRGLTGGMQFPVMTK